MAGLTASLSNPNSYGNACFLDGVPVNCTAAAMMVNHGSAQVDYMLGSSPFAGSIIPVPDPPDKTTPGPDDPTFPDPEHPETPHYDGGTTHGFVAVQFFISPGAQLTTTTNPQRPGFAPSQPTIPIQNLRGNIETMLSKGDCGKYVQQLLDKAAELNPRNSPRAKTILEALDNISSQGGYVLTTGIGYHTVSGDYYVHKETGGATWALSAMVHIIPWYNPSGRPPSARTTAQAQAYYALAALHETFHLAARGGYNDEQMAIAAASLPGAAPGLPKPGSDVGAFSNYWDHELAKHCPEMKVK
jgi:hypothetical protein